MSPSDTFIAALAALLVFGAIRFAISSDAKVVHLYRIRQANTFKALVNLEWNSYLAGWDAEVMNAFSRKLCDLASTPYECFEAFKVWMRIPYYQVRGDLSPAFLSKWDRIGHIEVTKAFDDLHALRRLYDNGLYQQGEIGVWAKRRIRALEGMSTVMT